MARFRTWTDFDRWLAEKGLFHMELGLERMRAAIRMLGKPQFSSIQVLGTNGKGSTCAFISSLAAAHGFRCGLYTSPHFVSIKERISINGQTCAENKWLDAVNRIGALPLADDLTYFEFLTLAALEIFRQQKIRLAVFEAGLGGRNDATTAIGASIHCITPIAMDHAAIIGPSIDDIAQDKGAAIGPGSRVFAAEQFQRAKSALARICSEKGARIKFTEPLNPEDLSAPCLPGRHQLANASLALAAWREAAAMHGHESDARLERLALSKAFLPGRMQHIKSSERHPEIWLDGAHNPHAMLSLARNLPIEPKTVIFSALRDKNWRDGLGILLKKWPHAQVIMPQLANGRAESAKDMVLWAASKNSGARACANLEDALALAESPVLMCGSLYLLAEFFTRHPEYLHMPADDRHRQKKEEI